MHAGRLCDWCGADLDDPLLVYYGLSAYLCDACELARRMIRDLDLLEAAQEDSPPHAQPPGP